MRIFTKKAFEFKNAAGEKVVTQPLSFTDVPDWAAKDPIFGWGVKDGDITVTETAKDEKAVETEAPAKSAAKGK
jgi:hypothetical protein